MATPAAAGLGALLIQDWRGQNAGARPTPATVKALLICGARDLGNTGPDYRFGYGAVNATESASRFGRGARSGSG